jgi:threonylcarbamoyladenosine tRNA methylthiotransferase MtaB
MSRTYRIVTLGCKVNRFESAYLEEALSRAGCRPALDGDPADLSVVNTCIVTRTAAHQSRQAVRKALRESPGARVAAIGCYAQVFPEELAAIEGLALIAGNAFKGRVPELVLGDTSTKLQIVGTGPFNGRMPFDRMPLTRFSDRSRAFVKIQDGCESFCNYCIVPFARGPCRSLPAPEALSMLESLARFGYREAVLTGIHLGKYGADLEGAANLATLLRKIGEAGLPMRIRLSSLEPSEIGEELIDMAVSERWLCPHFHIPLQSGDDGVLKRMNRGYRAREFAERVAMIHDRIPHGAVGADVMCGFPGESDAAHRNTVALIRDLPLSYLHVFPYSRRRGTPAWGFDCQVGPDTIKARAAEMRTVGEEKRRAFYRTCLGRRFTVLAQVRDPGKEGQWKGISDNYLPVGFQAESGVANRLLEVRMDRVVGNRLEGTIQPQDGASHRRVPHAKG